MPKSTDTKGLALASAFYAAALVAVLLVLINHAAILEFLRWTWVPLVIGGALIYGVACILLVRMEKPTAPRRK